MTPTKQAHRAAVDTRHGVALYLEDITLSFDGFRVLDRLTLTVDRGELRCLIGPNGAGKTTLMDVVTGRIRPDAGSAWFGQRLDLLQLGEAEIARAGIGRKFQRPTVFEQQTVLDNLALAASHARDLWPALLAQGRADRDALQALLERIDLAAAADALAGSLSHGQKQWLELGMLLAQDPLLLLVDEPVAGMTEQEAERTGELLTELAGDHTVIVVEHDMTFVRRIARTVTVLHEGRVLAEGAMTEVQADPRVVEVYLGKL